MKAPLLSKIIRFPPAAGEHDRLEAVGGLLVSALCCVAHRLCVPENTTSRGGVWWNLEINVRDEQKLVEVWLTRAERGDGTVRERLKPLYAAYKEKKYMVAVYESGVQELYGGTLDLLCYNKWRCAEIDVQREKAARAATIKH